MRSNPSDWIQNPIGTKDKASYQPLINELLSKKASYDSSQSSVANARNLGNYGRPNPDSLLSEPDVGNWSSNARGSSYEERLGSIPTHHPADSWASSDRGSGSASGLSARDASLSSNSARYGIVKTGTSSSVHPLAAAAFSGGGLEITGGASSTTSSRVDSSGARRDRSNQQWIAPTSNVSGKGLAQDSWRSGGGASCTGGILLSPQQPSWRGQQESGSMGITKPPQEDLNVVAQKLNSTLTRILNDYKPTGGLFSNPTLKIGSVQQRQDQGMFRPGPIGDKLSLAQNIALALTNMGMANVPQHELVAILQHLGLLGGGGQGMMPSGNRVMDDLRETVSRFERTFQYHRF